MNENDINRHDINGLLLLLLEEHNLLSTRVNLLLKEDLAQTSNIVKDVIIRLINSFSLITKDIDSLTGKLSDYSDFNVNNETIVSNIKSSITIIQRCLQFEDIVQQLIVHSIHLIEQKEKLLINMSDEISEISTEQEYSVRNESLNRIIAAIKKTAEIIDKESPVKQSSLKKGNIELF